MTTATVDRAVEKATQALEVDGSLRVETDGLWASPAWNCWTELFEVGGRVLDAMKAQEQGYDPRTFTQVETEIDTETSYYFHPMDQERYGKPAEWNRKQETKKMTLAEFKNLHQAGARLQCIDHWIPSRIGTERVVTRARSGYYECSMADEKSYRSSWPKASELTWVSENTYRVDSELANGTPTFWVMRLL